MQFFEYVTDSSGNLYGCYNCVTSDGALVPFDSGVANFIKWQFVKTEEKADRIAVFAVADYLYYGKNRGF